MSAKAAGRLNVFTGRCMYARAVSLEVSKSSLTHGLSLVHSVWLLKC